jgi:phosphoribosylaminoimidazolecarboxamide formyltransferase/IMP cyclohydrolase
MPDLVPIRRALISVSDKTDLIPFARALAGEGGLGAEIISTGGTAKALAEAGIPVTPIDRLTGFPEILGGRVKTLHPMVHGGLLAVRDDPGHAAAMQKHGIRPIDLVCINLYPFEKTIAQPGVSQSKAIEQIDIGGPSMIRSAAKNFAYVTVITSPAQYDRVVQELQTRGGQTSARLRAELAATAPWPSLTSCGWGMSRRTSCATARTPTRPPPSTATPLPPARRWSPPASSTASSSATTTSGMALPPWRSPAPWNASSRASWARRSSSTPIPAAPRSPARGRAPA